jgi:hypothetical protein
MKHQEMEEGGILKGACLPRGGLRRSCRSGRGPTLPQPGHHRTADPSDLGHEARHLRAKSPTLIDVVAE